MTGNSITVAGIEIPSSDPAFLATVGIHVMLGLACTITGIDSYGIALGDSGHMR